MSNRTTASLNAQDCLICRTVLGFVYTPLVLLLVAGTALAL
jgi:hypothetical protein